MALSHGKSTGMEPWQGVKAYARAILMIGLIAASPAWAPPAQADSEPVTITFWNGFTGPDGRLLQEIVNEFNSEHKGRFRVNMVVMPWLDFYNKVALSLSTPRGPDIGVVHFDNVYSVINQGIAMPLDPWLDRFPTDYIPAVWKVCQQNDHQYGIPLDVHPMTFYWNKDIFRQAGLDPEKPPVSREEFLKVCQVIKEKDLKKAGQKIYACAMPTGWPHQLVWMHILFCNNGQMFSKDFTKAMFDSSEGIDALKFMCDLIFKYGYSPPNVSGYESAERFSRGTTAMEINGSWMMTSFTDNKALNFGARAMINLGSGPHRVWSSSHVMMVFNKRNQTPERIDAGLRFMRFLSDRSMKWGTCGMIPARLSIIHSEEYKKIPIMPNIACDVEKIRFCDSHYRYFEGTETLTEHLGLALLGKMSPEEALRKATERTNYKLAQDPD